MGWNKPTQIFLKRVHIKLNNKDKPAQHMEQNDELI